MLDLGLLMPSFSDEFVKISEAKAVEKRKPSGVARRLGQIGALGVGTAAGTLGVGAIHGILAQEPGLRNKYLKMPPATRKRMWRGVSLGVGIGTLIGAAVQDRLRAGETERRYGQREDDR